MSTTMGPGIDRRSPGDPAEHSKTILCVAFGSSERRLSCAEKTVRRQRPQAHADGRGRHPPAQMADGPGVDSAQRRLTRVASTGGLLRGEAGTGCAEVSNGKRTCLLTRARRKKA